MNNNEIYKAAINKWGDDIQIEIAIEECAELIKAIQKFKRNGPSAALIHDVIEEIADVSIMIEQLTMIFGADHVEAKKQIKLDRLRYRISEYADEKLTELKIQKAIDSLDDKIK